MPILKIKDESTQQWQTIASVTGVQGPQGPQGPQGDPGVYVGSAAPTDPNINIWFDPNETSIPVVTSVNGQTGAITAVNSVNGQSGTVVLPTTISLTLLWTNPSPTASFGAQTIEMDLTDYDMALVFCRTFAETDTNTSVMSGVILKGVKCAIQIQSPVSSNAGIRRVTMTDTGFEFMVGSYNGSTNNDDGIPLYIYGIKGVITS